MSSHYPKFTRKHIVVMQWLLEHPGATLTECGKEIGYSRSWLSRIVNAPAFKTKYHHLLDTEVTKAVRRNLGHITESNSD